MENILEKGTIACFQAIVPFSKMFSKVASKSPFCAAKSSSRVVQVGNKPEGSTITNKLLIVSPD